MILNQYGVRIVNPDASLLVLPEHEYGLNIVIDIQCTMNMIRCIIDNLHDNYQTILENSLMVLIIP